jgi:sucrose phosphorylase
MANIFAVAEKHTDGHSAIASVIPQWFTLPHQINATLPNIVKNDTGYIIMRAVQFFLPGEPQVYYVGLFNGMDDRDLFTRSGQGRDTNRHNYTPAEIQDALKHPVTQAIIALARVRKHAAFEGEFSWGIIDAETMRLEWSSVDSSGGEHKLSLEFKTAVDAPSFVVEATADGGVRRFTSVEELAKY